MIDQHDVSWQGRAHFFGIAAQMMRRILVDHARGRDAAKRGAGACKLTLDEDLLAPAERDINLVALDQALDTLSNSIPTRTHRGTAFLRRLVDRGNRRSPQNFSRDRKA
jgi:hypothetical protein